MRWIHKAPSQNDRRTIIVFAFLPVVCYEYSNPCNPKKVWVWLERYKVKQRYCIIDGWQTMRSFTLLKK